MSKIKSTCNVLQGKQKFLLLMDEDVYKWPGFAVLTQDVFPQQTVPINVPGYSASLNTSTLSHTMDQYNKIVTPNSPNTAWYMK
jgi:hypothetical protein